MTTFLAFLAVALVVIVTPGPDTALAVRNTVAGGRAAGILTAAGVAFGQIIWALATSLGIVALLVASEPLFLAIKYAGAAYLVYLGVHSLREAMRPSAQFGPTSTADPVRQSLRPGAAFRQGVISNLGNPKMAVFFASLLPQFVLIGEETFAQLLSLGLVFAAITLAWLAAISAALAHVGSRLRRPGVRRVLEGVSGAVLVSLGLRLALDRGSP